MAMTIEEFRSEMMEDLRLSADYYETDTEDVFLNDTFETLSESGAVSDPVRFYFGKNGRRNRMMQLHGYAYDLAEGSLSLIISDFKDSDLAETLTQTQIDTLCKRLLNFLDEACNGDISQFCDDSDETIRVAAEMKNKLGASIENSEILRIRLIIVSNAMLSSQVKSLKAGEFMGRPTEVNIWALERFYELKMSSMVEPLNITIANYGVPGIPCIKADLGNVTSYEAYLAIIPGKLLADIYLDYGSRLLEGNVRAFLGEKKKVNVGIRSTIKNEPQYFFTYNNGIATTAESVTVEKSDSGLLITALSNLQIINGGQTTASLASAILKGDNKKLDGIFVPMKLTVVNPDEENSESRAEGDEDAENDSFEERFQKMIEKISRCANSQNAVSDADFYSNHPFHVLMEKKSLKLLAPPKSGATLQTIWFYERSRGKWEQAQMKMKPGERKAFLRKSPKNQKVTKEKFAKCYNAYLMKPYSVAKGAARNMKVFAAYISDLWEKKKDYINDFFFKKAIVSIILFDETDRIINTQDWYPRGGCKAELVPYTISKIISSIPPGKWIDINRIWNSQELYPSFVMAIEYVAKETFDFLTENARGGLVRTFAQQESTWEKFRNIHLELPPDFVDDMVEIDSIREQESEQRREQNLDNQLSLEIQVYNLGADFWNRLLEEGMQNGLLSEKDMDLLNIGCRLNAPMPRLPSPKQAKLMMAIKTRLEQAGISVKK